jgi:membrane fusion protein, copper/silver efflux system
MRKRLRNSSIKVIALLLLLLASCNKNDNHADHADVYTCPMHPTVVSDKPGTCPVCGMDLVRKARPGDEIKITEDLARLMKSPNQSVVSSIETVKPAYKTVPVSLKAVGIVTYDTRNIYTIPARFGGRIEKMFLKYEFQRVHKGQKIAEIYSPEIITAQRELLYLMKNDSTNDVLVEGAKRKLELLGLTSSQLKELFRQQQPTDVLGVYSPYEGYVIINDGLPSGSQVMTQIPSTDGEMGGMGSKSSSASPSASNNSNVASARLVREGDYVSSGQTLLKLVNTNALRIELDLAGGKNAMVKVGDKITLDLGNGKTEHASVDFVQPFFNEGQTFLKIRVYAKKVRDLYIGQLVRANIELEPKESLWIPKEAVLDLGTDKIVFVKNREVLTPKKVVTGIEADGQTEVLSGLSSSEEVAVNAQYLVDSESFIKPIQ